MRHAKENMVNNQRSHLDIDDPSNVIVINGHKIAYQSGNNLIIDSGVISTVWMKVTPAHVRVIIHADKLVIDDLGRQDRRLYLKLESQGDPSAAMAYFTRHGFAVELNL